VGKGATEESETIKNETENVHGTRGGATLMGSLGTHGRTMGKRRTKGGNNDAKKKNSIGNRTPKKKRKNRAFVGLVQEGKEAVKKEKRTANGAVMWRNQEKECTGGQKNGNETLGKRKTAKES